ncbi:MAG: hypothetical protein Q4C14_06460 [Bacillota bacterium]|nr:hypothetical protein [Bacillota bacterium]
MFGKLIKYEMKSMLKVFSIAWGAILVVALISGLSMTNDIFVISANDTAVNSMSGQIAGMVEMISTMLYIGLAVALVALTMVFVISRFGKGLLGDEGYLMFTLPTTPRKLITAKGVSATIIMIISAVVGALSMVVFILPSTEGVELKAMFSFISEAVSRYPQAIPMVIEGIVLAILAAVNFIYHIYASIAIGHLSSKHRVLFSVIAFIGISVVFEILAGLAVTVLREFEWLENILNNTVNDLQGVTIVFGMVCLAEIAGIVIFHIITEYILNKKLNLL